MNIQEQSIRQCAVENMRAYPQDWNDEFCAFYAEQLFEHRNEAEQESSLTLDDYIVIITDEYQTRLKYDLI